MPDPTPLVPGPIAPKLLPTAHNREGGISDACSECSIKGGLLNEGQKLWNGGRESSLCVTLRS